MGLLARRGLRRTYLAGVRPLRTDSGWSAPPSRCATWQRARTSRSPRSPPIPRIRREGDRDCATGLGPGDGLPARDLPAGLGGSFVARPLLRRGVAGVVLDGGVRDAAEIEASGFPTFRAGPASPPNNVLHHAVELNTPIACGPVAVYPGEPHLRRQRGRRGGAASFGRAGRQRRLRAGAARGVSARRGRRRKSIVGVYPPSEATLDRYRAWRRQR